jgi:hypothetical protein
MFDRDPDAAANEYYHDLVSLNLYRAPDDIYRVFSMFKDIQKQHGIDKPIWLTETNAMPTDDHAISCPHADAPIQTTMDQQAAYAVQALAMAASAGYQRYEFYRMIDQDPCTAPAVLGITRDDGSRRPVSDALQTAVTQFGGYDSVHFMPLVRETEDWSPWPDDPSSLIPNWQVYQVAFDKAGNRRVTVLWNGDGASLRVRIRKNGSKAVLMDRQANTHPVQDSQGWWVMDLAGATAHFPEDPAGYHFIGGEPLLLIEDGVDPSAPVVPPALGDPGTLPREFRLFPNPKDGQTVNRGEPADFFVSVRGYEGFSDPVTFTLDHWSTQRFPQPQDPGTLPLALTLPANVAPGLMAVVQVGTAGADPGIYYLDLVATGGGISQAIELPLVVD